MMLSWPNDQQTTPNVAEPSEETVTIVDPAHILFGQTFRLLGVVNRTYVGRCCVIERDSGRQYVPLAATDRSPEPLAIFPLPLSISAIQQLLAVYARIEQQVAEDTDSERYQEAARHSRGRDDSSGGREDTSNPDPTRSSVEAIGTRTTGGGIQSSRDGVPESDQHGDAR
jgi:hypothetical protein